MRKIQLLLFLTLSSLPSLLWGARGAEGGNGGGSIVCFSIPSDEAIGFDGIMTPSGRSHIRSAQVYDLFKLGSEATSRFYQKIKSMHFVGALSVGESLFDGIPEFRGKLNHARAVIGLVPDGFPAPYGLTRVGDAGTALGLPEDCSFVQAATRDVDQLSFDPVVWSMLPEAQKAILQLHEELYYTVSETYPRDSTGVQLLIIALLRSDQSPESLRAKLSQYGFGSYSTRAEIRRGKAKLLEAQDFVIARLETYLAHLRRVAGSNPQADSQAIQACSEIGTYSLEMDQWPSTCPELSLPPLKVFRDTFGYASHARDCSDFWFFADRDLDELRNSQTELKKLPF